MVIERAGAVHSVYTIFCALSPSEHLYSNYKHKWFIANVHIIIETCKWNRNNAHYIIIQDICCVVQPRNSKELGPLYSLLPLSSVLYYMIITNIL